jgi:hypothetical protein
MDASAVPNRTPRASKAMTLSAFLVGAAAPAACDRSGRPADNESAPPRPHAPPLRHDPNRYC